MFSFLSTYRGFKKKNDKLILLPQVGKPQVESYCALNSHLQAEPLLQGKCGPSVCPGDG